MTLIALAVVFGAALRMSDLRVAFCANPDELAEVMPGLRLHALPWWNIGGDVRGNFFTSMLYSQHGLGDTAFFYLASGSLGLMGLPVSDRGLWLAAGVTNGVLVAASAWFAWVVAGSRAMAAVAALLLAVSPFFVFTSQSGWARCVFVSAIQMLTLCLGWIAVRRNSRVASIGLAVVALLLTLTDGFFFAPVLLLFLFLLHDGTLAVRLRAALASPAFRLAAAAIIIGIGANLAVALVATARGTNLTLFRYVLLRGAGGGVWPDANTFVAWFRTFGWYFPDARYFWVVLGAWLLALRSGIRNPVAGTLAVWWVIVSVGIIRYTAGLQALGQPAPVPMWVNAYMLALPSYLLVAWACGHLMEQQAGIPLRIAAVAIAASIALPLAAQARAGEVAPLQTLRGSFYNEHKSECQVVKAASYYVRRHGTPESTIFHLTSNNFLGHFGEFYYGVSYGSNARTGERNRLLDFGEQIVGRKVTPEAFARAYGVPHFSYYVEFVPSRDPFSAAAVARLHAAGARAVFDIREQGTTIGRVWSFQDAPVEAMEFADAARLWNDYGSLSELIRQPLAGTAYHFGYGWPSPAGD